VLTAGCCKAICRPSSMLPAVSCSSNAEASAEHHQHRACNSRDMKCALAAAGKRSQAARHHLLGMLLLRALSRGLHLTRHRSTSRQRLGLHNRGTKKQVSCSRSYGRPGWLCVGVKHFCTVCSQPERLRDVRANCVVCAMLGHMSWRPAKI
jgi:hypothetical protein